MPNVDSFKGANKDITHNAVGDNGGDNKLKSVEDFNISENIKSTPNNIPKETVDGFDLDLMSQMYTDSLFEEDQQLKLINNMKDSMNMWTDKIEDIEKSGFFDSIDSDILTKSIIEELKGN